MLFWYKIHNEIQFEKQFHFLIWTHNDLHFLGDKSEQIQTLRMN